VAHVRQLLHPDFDNAFPTCSLPQRQRTWIRRPPEPGGGTGADLETMAAAGSSPSSSSSSKRCVPCFFLHFSPDPWLVRGFPAPSSTPPSMACFYAAQLGCYCSSTYLLLQKEGGLIQNLDQNFHLFASKGDESKDPPRPSTGAFSGRM
jgi:hypothetical protein